MKIAYLGYDLLTPCLTALWESGAEVLEVFTFPTDNEFEFNREMYAFAQARQIPCTEERITLADIHRLKNNGCEAIVCAGYIYKVPIDHTLPIVNVHPALLPLGRGAWPMPVTLLRHLPVSGVTLHKMEAELDTGDILLQKSFPVRPEDNLETLTQTICQVGAELCRQLMQDFVGLWKNAKPQGPGEYWKCPQKPDYTITEKTPPQETQQILRAFFGYDCYLQTNRQEYRLVRGQFHPLAHDRPFGQMEGLPDGRCRYYVRGGVIETPAQTGI